VTSLSRRAVVE
jgi:hypothetical protein